MNTTTPPSITPYIAKFVQRFKSNAKPLFVPCIPIDGEKLDDCFNVIARKIEREGGGIQHGWAIWEWPTIMVEAEFHAVWVSPDEKMIDVAPRPEAISQILFLKDDTRVFNGLRIPNKRMPLRDHAKIKELIRISQEITKVEGPETGTMRLKGDDAIWMRNAILYQQQLIRDLSSMTPKLPNPG